MKYKFVGIIAIGLSGLISSAQMPVQVPVPAPGKALICVYHMRETFGGWWLHDVAHPDMLIDGSFIETVYGAGYFVLQVNPGKHVLNASKHVSTIVDTTFDQPLDVEADKSYFVKITNHFSGVNAHNAWTLGVVSKEQAQKEMSGLKQTYTRPD